MDVTPTKNMYAAMESLTSAICGEEPGKLEQGVGARRIRENRAFMMQIMHQIVALSMREGAARALNPFRTELGAMQADADMKFIQNG